MKTLKITTMLAVLMLAFVSAVSASYIYNAGDFVFEVIDNARENDMFGANGEDVTIKVLEGEGIIFIADFIESAVGNGVVASYLDVADTSKYGYAGTEDGSSKISAEGKKILVRNENGAVQYGYTIGKFSSGATISLFIEDRAGVNSATDFDKVNDFNHAELAAREFGEFSDVWGEPGMKFDIVSKDSGETISQLFAVGGYTIDDITGDIAFAKVVPSEPVPAGQPLPGVLASLAIGLAVLKLRRKK